MKKLIQILGATSLVVSAPLALVACGPDLPGFLKPGEHDFELARTKFIKTTKTIFDTNLDKDLEPLRFTNESDNPFDHDFTIKYLLTNSAKIASGVGEEFKFVESEIAAQIRWDQIVNQVNLEVVQEPNFKPLLIQGKNPIADGYKITAININGIDDEIATININITSNIAYSNAIGERETLEIAHQSQINLVSDIDIAEELNAINERFTELINGSDQANGYKVVSNKGDADIVGNIITSKTGEVHKKILSLGTSVTTSKDEIEIDLSELSLTLDKTNIAVGSTTFSPTSFEWHNLSNDDQLRTQFRKDLKDGFLGDDVAVDRAVNVLSGNESNSVFKRNESDFIKGNVSKFNNMSVQINQYAVQENFEENKSFSDKTNQKAPKFEFDLLNDNKLISLFGIDIDGAKIKYKNTVLDLSKNFIAVRQNTQEQDTMTLYKKFLKDAINYQRVFFGFGSKGSTNLGEFAMKQPSTWQRGTHFNRALDFEDYKDELFQAAAKEALDIQDNLSLKSQILGTVNVDKYRFIEQFYINNKSVFYGTFYKDGRDFKTGAINERWKFSTFFFSEGMENYTRLSAGVGFNLYGMHEFDKNPSGYIVK